jgi:uncharacterized membrane protein YeaQ/YmgE (transglycosylase-associated protein family)
MFFILFIILWGMAVGWVANMIVGRGQNNSWALLMGAGLGGSFIGGLILSLISGDGLAFKPSGIIGSLLGAIIVLAIVQYVRGSSAKSGKASGKKD